MWSFLVLAALALPRAPAASTERPHVVLVMTDDMGWMDLRCQGNGKLITPRIDALASEGVRFTEAYAGAPVCSPTRASLMTGHAPARLHITQHGADRPHFWPDGRTIQPPATRDVLPHETTTIAERLHEAGYATGFFGKWHLSGTDPVEGDPTTGGPDFYPDRHGFEINIGGCGFGGPPTYFDPYRIPTLPSLRKGEYLTDRLADEAIAWMSSVPQGRPMFVCLWTYNPHYPFEAPAELVEHFRGKQGPGLRNPIYGGQIEATDRAVGRVLDALDELGIAGQTLVLFTSDNGGWAEATDNRPLRAGKGDVYEGGIRVPLIIRWPGVAEPGTTDATPVVSMDLTATILDAAGVGLAEGESLDGVSLRPVLAGDDLEPRALFWHYPHFAWHRSNRPAAAIREGRWKLIRRFDDDSVELYDLAVDLGETRDLASTHPDLAASLDARLEAWLVETDAGRPTKR
jgi:arylsulfatase A-like enzyme